MDTQNMDLRLIGAAMDCGAFKAAVADTSNINFRPEFRDMCVMNACGMYGRCWMCPPDIGPIESLIERAKGYKKALVMQTIGVLEDSFDIDGMQRAAKAHNAVLLAFRDEIGDLPDALYLGAGACQICARCTRLDGAPCRCEKLAIASLEAYGIAVSELSDICGMKYVNGVNTVTYFAAVLYGQRGEGANASG